MATDASIERTVADRSPATIIVEPNRARIAPSARRTRADIVLVDVTMPSVDGPEILRQLTKLNPTPVVIFTRSIAESLRQALAPRRRRSPERRAVAALECGSVAALAAVPDRPLSQQWARWFYEHPLVFGNVDGISYPNAHNQDVAHALFERAEDALVVTADLPLADPLLRAEIRAIAEQCNLIIEPY